MNRYLTNKTRKRFLYLWRPAWFFLSFFMFSPEFSFFSPLNKGTRLFIFCFMFSFQRCFRENIFFLFSCFHSCYQVLINGILRIFVEFSGYKTTTGGFSNNFLMMLFKRNLMRGFWRKCGEGDRILNAGF